MAHVWNSVCVIPLPEPSRCVSTCFWSMWTLCCMLTCPPLGSYFSFVPDVVHHQTYHNTFFFSFCPDAVSAVSTPASMWLCRVTAAAHSDHDGVFLFLDVLNDLLFPPHWCIVLVCLPPRSVLCKSCMCECWCHAVTLYVALIHLFTNSLMAVTVSVWM